MAYDRTTQATVVISRKHHALLKDISKKQKRNLQNTLEYMIENYKANI